MIFNLKILDLIETIWFNCIFDREPQVYIMCLIVIWWEERERACEIWAIWLSFISVECIGLHHVSPPNLTQEEKKRYIMLDLGNWIEWKLDTQSTKNQLPYHLVYMRKRTYMIYLREFLKLFKYLASNSIYTVTKWLDLPINTLHQEKKRRNDRILTRLVWAPRLLTFSHYL